MKKTFIDSMRSKELKKSEEVLTEMMKNLQKNDDFFEYLSLTMNKTVISTQKKEWISVISECLNGLRIIKRLRENPERFKHWIKDKESKTKLNEMEKR
jgi:hypothetical protein